MLQICYDVFMVELCGWEKLNLKKLTVKDIFQATRKRIGSISIGILSGICIPNIQRITTDLIIKRPEIIIIPAEQQLTINRLRLAIPAMILLPVVIGPICEELIFREGLQTVLLKNKLGKVIEQRYPRILPYWHGHTGKIVRVLTLSVPFGLLHMTNYIGAKPTEGFSVLQLALLTSLISGVSGIVFGLLREYRKGMSAPIMAHVTTNAIVTYFIISTMYQYGLKPS